MVSVCRSDKRDLTDLFLHFRADQFFIRKFGNADTQSFCHVVSDRVAAAQNLESVQAESVTLIFDVDRSYTQFIRKGAETDQRSLLIFREALVETARLLCGGRTETAYRIQSRSRLSLKMYCLNSAVCHLILLYRLQVPTGYAIRDIPLITFIAQGRA